MDSTQHEAEPIAIIGIGLRLPGGVSNTDEFWDLLLDGKDGKCRVPSDRYNVEAFHGQGRRPQNVVTENGYFLKDTNLKASDASFFSVTDGTDPQQRLLCEVVWECLESAGQTNLRGTDAGVFVGCFGEDWHNIIQADKQLSTINRVMSGGDFVLSNRISYEFDLRGPSMTIRTACSASISGLHMACQALRAGDCPTAIVAGTSLIMEPSMTLDMSRSGVLSPSGTCKTFDATADGFARGEAINALLIKPLKDALRDGDPIRAVIRSTSVNSDGRLSRVGCPSKAAQVSAIQRAYKVAGIDDFSLTPFIECHGTGTPVGDPIEVAAVAEIFGKRGDTYIGSVKPNVGHGEGASGITSIIKAVLSLENKTIPPNIFFSKPNPRIPLDKYKLKVPVEPVPWPKDRHERISVNSFGIGGANAHVIIDSAASFGIAKHASKAITRQCSGPTQNAVNGTSFNGTSNMLLNGNDTHPIHRDCASDDIPNRHINPAMAKTSNGINRHAEQNMNMAADSWPRLLLISAKSAKSLQRRADGLREYVQSSPHTVNDVAHTLSLHRMHLSYRTFCVLKDGVSEGLNFGAAEKISTRPGDPKVVYVFTGQGAQWNGMGRTLIHGSPSFLQDVRAMDSALQQLTEPPQWKIEELLSSSDDDAKFLEKSDVVQSLCTAIQLGLVNFLTSCGIAPSAVIGHSSGEIAAAYAAGALTMSEAILNAYFRGQVASRSRPGGMAAIGMSRDALVPYLLDGVQIACENSPNNVTISGDIKGVKRVLDVIKSQDPDVFARLLPVDVPYHSDHMSELGGLYEKLLLPHLSCQTASCVIYSSTYGQAVTDNGQLGPSYWKTNFESPVLFYKAMKNLLQDIPDAHVVLEIGTHPALQASLRQIIQELNLKNAPAYIPTLFRGEDSAVSLVTAVGKLYTHGFPVEFSFLNCKASVLIDLPNYPWNYSPETWPEPRISTAWRFKKHSHHELLGSRCLESSDREPAWRNILQLMDVPWLQDHMVNKTIVFPAAGYIAMMGEAIKQIVNSAGYVLRNLMVKSTLVISEKDTIEIMTAMRPARLTQLTNSSWYELSVSSYNGSSWAELCIAQGMASDDTEIGTDVKTITPYARQITAENFYGGMGHMGLNYGPQFQRLQSISAHTEKRVASATVLNKAVKQSASYSIHPTTLDSCLQLCAAAELQGLARNLDVLKLPVSMRLITVKPARDNLVAEASMDLDENRYGVVAVSKETNEPVIMMNGMKVVVFDNGGSEGDRDMHAARIEWRPDIDCLVANDIIRRRPSKHSILLDIEKVSALAMLQTLDTIKSLEAPLSGHLAKYASWLKNEKDAMSQGTADAQHWASMDAHSRQTLLEFLVQQIHERGDQQASAFARTICSLAKADTVAGVFAGHIEPTEAVTDDRVDVLHKLYGDMASADEFLQLCAHSKPAMNVLEIGAGTGVDTESVLESITSKGGVRMYAQYMFTDKSPERLDAARRRFATRKQIVFQTLDIEKDPAEQGFESGSFDLIVASHALHATSSIHKSLRNLHTLLRPGGRLYLQQAVSPLRWQSIKFVLGLLPEWWTGGDDGRLDTPYISVERWANELRDAGFSGLDAANLDDDSPYHGCAHITSMAVAPIVKPDTVTILYNETRHEFALQLARTFEKENVAVQWRKLSEMDDKTAGTHDIISTIDLEDPILRDISEENYTNLIKCLSHVKMGVLWLTRAAQVDAVDPDYGLILGLARTIRLELSLDFWTAELQTLDFTSSAAVAAISRKFWARDPIGRKIDAEYSVRDGVVWIGRYHWTSTLESAEPQLRDDYPKQLLIGQYGRLDSIQWVQQEPIALQSEEVEFEVRCVGLNFKDIMVSMGIVPGPKDSLGLEATGVITRLGSAVTHLKEGDRVCALATGLLSTRKTVHVDHVMPITQHLTFEEAATMQVVFMTAIYTLITLGQLEKGQSVLIHSAAGGVGQAAIQICQLLGAEIYVTVGSEEKIEYLITNYGIPRERIFSSRSVSFLDGVMRSTLGRGVDIVLNSLSGDLLHASWQCVAKYGKMMEIGKRDILEQGSLAINLFEHNRTFYGIDLLGVMHDRRALARRLTDQFEGLVAANKIKPIQPSHVFPATKVSEALRFMQKGQHTGKIVISMPDGSEQTQPSEQLPVAKAIKSVSMSAGGTYLIIGGLGGLGQAVTTWLVERGARSFVFLSRSAGKREAHQAFFRELESQGCCVAAVAGSVAEIADVKRAVEAAPSPIAGVLQMSMVLTDVLLPDLSYNDWRAVQDPKVKGTWNLHNALFEANAKLDFFILFSSISGLLGHPYQANYSSANTFLSSFVQYRHSLGLPCSVIELGGVEGIGFLSDRPDRINMYRASGLFLLREQEVIDAVQVSMAHSLPGPEGGYVFVDKQPGARSSRSPYTNMSQIAVGLKSTKPLSDPRSQTVFRSDMRASMYANMETSPNASTAAIDADLHKFLKLVSEDPEMLSEPDTVDFVSREVGLMLFTFLQVPEEQLDVKMSLVSIGIDSLVSIEIRNWWRRTLGLDTTVLEIMNAATIEGLGKMTISRLQEKYGVKPGRKDI